MLSILVMSSTLSLRLLLLLLLLLLLPQALQHPAAGGCIPAVPLCAAS
jgi:hypothetical protein